MSVDFLTIWLALATPAAYLSLHAADWHGEAGFMQEGLHMLP